MGIIGGRTAKTRSADRYSQTLVYKKYINNLVYEFPRSRIHERTVTSKFLGIILRVLRLEVSAYRVYITNQFQSTFAQGEEGSKFCYIEVTVSRKEKKSEDFCPSYVQEFGLWQAGESCSNLFLSGK